jgi:hypothetical protein
VAWRGRIPAVVVAVLVAAGIGTPAEADPLPGFDLDPDQLAERMDTCLAYMAGEQEILMGWRNLRDGTERHWRCSSLRHMMLDDHGTGEAHDPYVDIVAFMRCADKVVSYGFPRRGDPGNTVLHYQYNGTSKSALAVVNHVTGDVVTMYTTNPGNDWAGCANGL